MDKRVELRGVSLTDERQAEVDAVACDLARWITERAGGDHLTATVTLMEVLAENIKLAPSPDHAIECACINLRKFMRVPNRYLVSVDRETAQD